MKLKHLFVYGTLRPELGGKQSAQLLSNATYVGPATFQVKLYLNDWYPGAVDSDDAAHRIVGDLFDVGDNPELFEDLDTYEGCSASERPRIEEGSIGKGARSLGAALLPIPARYFLA